MTRIERGAGIVGWLLFLAVLPFALIAHAAGKVRRGFRAARLVLHIRGCDQCKLSVGLMGSLKIGCGWQP